MLRMSGSALAIQRSPHMPANHTTVPIATVYQEANSTIRNRVERIVTRTSSRSPPIRRWGRFRAGQIGTCRSSAMNIPNQFGDGRGWSADRGRGGAVARGQQVAAAEEEAAGQHDEGCATGEVRHLTGEHHERRCWKV